MEEALPQKPCRAGAPRLLNSCRYIFHCLGKMQWPSMSTTFLHPQSTLHCNSQTQPPELCINLHLSLPLAHLNPPQICTKFRGSIHHFGTRPSTISPGRWVPKPNFELRDGARKEIGAPNVFAHTLLITCYTKVQAEAADFRIDIESANKG